MAVARRTWLPLSMLAAGLAGLGLLAWELFASSRDLTLASGDVASRSAALDASAAERDEERGRDRSPGIEPERKRDDDAYFATPDRDLLRQLEQRGRAQFWGLVLAPDGTPCEGATLFHNGKPKTTSDARGVWHIEVDHDIGGAFRQRWSRLPPVASISAHKEGVGTAAAGVTGPSRRIDLTLVPGHRLFGSCVDRETHAPVAHALVDLRFLGEPSSADRACLALATKAGPDGKFEFVGLPSGTFDLRGRVQGHDSNGFVPLDYSGDRDRGYTLLLDPMITVSGRFMPWPPPGGPWSPAPQVVVNTQSPHDHGSEPREFASEVDADGRFACAIPNCPSFVARLVSDNGALWRTDFQPEVVPRDVDLGRIELGETGWIRGRVLLPPQFAQIDCEVDVLGAGMDLAAKLGNDGSFAIGPLPPLRREWLDFQLQLGDGRSSLLRRAAVIAGEEGESEAPPLREGLDLGVPDLTLRWTDSTWIAGRVTDETGEPVANADVLVGRAGESDADWSDDGGTDARGCFVLTYGSGYESGTPAGGWNLAVRACGFTLQRFHVEPSEYPGFAWRDCKLARGARLRGVLVDDRGERLVGWRVAFVETEEALARRRAGHDSIYVGWNTVLTTVITDAAGEFDCHGLEGATLRAIVDSIAGDSQSFDDVPVIDGAITLRSTKREK